ncbi:hypothetical protein C8R44DRAFT_382678 [Mycena epipterygia]|nr:hypothetical protein C8R44DRAFT_382678 [Mycena epipterygia]
MTHDSLVLLASAATSVVNTPENRTHTYTPRRHPRACVCASARRVRALGGGVRVTREDGARDAYASAHGDGRGEEDVHAYREERGLAKAMIRRKGEMEMDQRPPSNTRRAPTIRPHISSSTTRRCTSTVRCHLTPSPASARPTGLCTRTLGPILILCERELRRRQRAARTPALIHGCWTSVCTLADTARACACVAGARLHAAAPASPCR